MVNVRDDSRPKIGALVAGVATPAMIVSGLVSPMSVLPIAIIGVLAAGVIALVVVPAVWSKDQVRRKAAFDVLGKILGR